MNNAPATEMLDDKIINTLSCVYDRDAEDLKSELTSTYLRNAKFWGLIYTEVFNLGLDEYNRVANNIIAHLSSGFKNGWITKLSKQGDLTFSTPIMHKMRNKEGKIIDNEPQPYMKLTAAQYCHYLRDNYPNVFRIPDFLEKGLVGLTGIHRAIYLYVVERFRSYNNRNNNNKQKHKEAVISIRAEKSINFKDAFVKIDIDNNALTFRTTQHDITINFNHSLKSQDLLDYMSSLPKDKLIKTDKFGEKLPKSEWVFDGATTGSKNRTGGNLAIKQRCFVAMLKKRFFAQYEPKTILSFDMNKSKEFWLTFNDGEIIEMPEETRPLFKELEYLNTILGDAKCRLDPKMIHGLPRLSNEDIQNMTLEQLSEEIKHSKRISWTEHDAQQKKQKKQKKKNKNKKEATGVKRMNTKQRSPFQWRRKKVHNKLEIMLKPYAMNIIQKALKTQALISIDGLKTGQTNGSFGQDKLPSLLVTLCQNNSIPYYVVNPAYSSQRCSKCGHTEEDNRPSTETFKCLECGHEAVSHENAAENIATYGKMMYQAGVPYGDYHVFMVAGKQQKIDTVCDYYKDQWQKQENYWNRNEN